MKQTQKNWKTMQRDSTKNLALWTGIWVLSTALATFGPQFIWNEANDLSLFAILLNLMFGIRMVIAIKQYLSSLDELQRKIQLDAMGISLGLAVVVGLFYTKLDMANIISFDAEISHLVIFVGITYLIACLIGNRRYS